MIADWIPLTVVFTSLATVAIDTFMTDESRIIKNWADASVSSTIPVGVALGFEGKDSAVSTLRSRASLEWIGAVRVIPRPGPLAATDPLLSFHESPRRATIPPAAALRIIRLG